MMNEYRIIPHKYQYFLLLLPYSHYLIMLCFIANFVMNRSKDVISTKRFRNVMLIWFVLFQCQQTFIPKYFGADLSITYPLTLSSISQVVYFYITCVFIGYGLIRVQEWIFDKYVQAHPEIENEFYVLSDSILSDKKSLVRGLLWVGGFVLCTFLGLYFENEIILLLTAGLLIVAGVLPWHQMLNGLFFYSEKAFTSAYKRGIVIMVGIMYVVAGVLMHISS